eukprot:1443679-Amphidinium_carterae.1
MTDKSHANTQYFFPLGVYLLEIQCTVFAALRHPVASAERAQSKHRPQARASPPSKHKPPSPTTQT